MRQFERKHVISEEIKAEPDGIITAYASTFGNTDSYGDVMKAGAFKKTIKERKNRVKVLFNHKTYDLPVGKPLELVEEKKGLLTSTKMSRIQLGQDIYTLAQEGALDSLSIGFYAMKAERAEESERKRGIWRYITEAKLMEYSFVNFPANEMAVITGLKSLEDLELQLKQWSKIYEADAGKLLNKETASRVVTALEDLKSIISSAGQATDEESKDDESQMYSLLESLENYSRANEESELEQRLREFSKSIGG